MLPLAKREASQRPACGLRKHLHAAAEELSPGQATEHRGLKCRAGEPSGQDPLSLMRGGSPQRKPGSAAWRVWCRASSLLLLLLLLSLLLFHWRWRHKDSPDGSTSLQLVRQLESMHSEGVVLPCAVHIRDAQGQSPG